MPRVESPIGPAAGQRRRNRIIEPNRPLARKNRNAAGFQPPTPSLVPVRSSSDESSPGSDDSSATPAVLQTGGCTVVWSNPAYRSELVSNSGSSSSSEGSTGFLINGSVKQDGWRTGETDCSVNFEFSSSEDRKVAGIGGLSEQSSSRYVGGSMQQQGVSFEYSCSDVKVAAAGAATTGETLEQTSSFMREDASDFGSTRKTLFDLPAFGEACSEGTGTCVFEAVDEGWVHGPDRDMESEACAAFVEAELEDEADRKLEAELQSGIAALSRKLAGMQQKTVTRSDPVVTRKPAAVSAAAAGQTTKQRKHESVPAAAKQSRQKTSNLNKANATERKQMPKEKPACVDKLALNRLEEQLKTLRLSPHFWGKNHDWVRSLRGGGAAAAAAAKAKAGPVKNSRPNRAVLGEKNVEDAGAKYQQQQPQANRLKENRQKTFTLNASRGPKQASKEVTPSAACVKAGGTRKKVDKNKTRN